MTQKKKVSSSFRAATVEFFSAEIKKKCQQVMSALCPLSPDDGAYSGHTTVHNMSLYLLFSRIHLQVMHSLDCDLAVCVHTVGANDATSSPTNSQQICRLKTQAALWPCCWKPSLKITKSTHERRSHVFCGAIMTGHLQEETEYLSRGNIPFAPPPHPTPH